MNQQNAFYVNGMGSSQVRFELIHLDPIAIGTTTNPVSQSLCGIAIGKKAGLYNQGECAIAIGESAGKTNQGMMSIALGSGAGSNEQSDLSIAIGVEAGLYNQGENAIAIGTEAGRTGQHAQSIVLNATGTALNTLGTERTYIAPIRNATVGDKVLTYNSSTHEVLQSNTIDGDLIVQGILQSEFDFFSYQFTPLNVADTTTISGLSNPTSDEVWFGGVLAPNGKIYCIPRDATNVLIIDPSSPVVSLSGTISSASYVDGTKILTCTGTNFLSEVSVGDNIIITNTVSAQPYVGYVQAVNSSTSITLIYALGVNLNAGQITGLQKTRRADITTITGLSSDADKWYGGILAPNGKIYCIPHSASSVLVIDPKTNTTSSIPGAGTNTFKWVGGVLAQNGKIYGIPASSTSVLIIDPSSHTIDTSTISGLPVGLGKWNGGVLGLNGKIYGIPRNATTVLYIDPITNTASTSVVTGTFTVPATDKWFGGALGSNGKIYGFPRDSQKVLYIDPLTNIADETTVLGTFLGTGKWRGGVLAPNGLIYGIPRDSDRVLIIDPVTNQANNTTITGLPVTSIKWAGAVLAPNGNIFGVPATIENVLIINTGTPSLPLWMLTPYFNKF
jgi:hypothetical protein